MSEFEKEFEYILRNVEPSLLTPDKKILPGVTIITAENYVIHFWSMFLFYNPLETTENFSFSAVFRGYRIETARNGLKNAVTITSRTFFNHLSCTSKGFTKVVKKLLSMNIANF